MEHQTWFGWAVSFTLHINSNKFFLAVEKSTLLEIYHYLILLEYFKHNSEMLQWHSFGGCMQEDIFHNELSLSSFFKILKPDFNFLWNWIPYCSFHSALILSIIIQKIEWELRAPIGILVHVFLPPGTKKASLHLVSMEAKISQWPKPRLKIIKTENSR